MINAEKINGMDVGVTAEYIKIGGVRMGEPTPYRLIFDRISHDILFYDASLRNLEFPLDWDGVIEHVSLPAILKPHNGGGWKNV